LKFLNKYSDSSIRFIYVIITVYCLIITGIPFFRAAVSQRLTLDGSTKNIIQSENGNSVAIYSVIPGSSAEKAGLKPGDIIIAVNKRSIKEFNDFNNFISHLPENSPVIYTIDRNGQIFDVEIHVNRYFHLVFYIFFSLGFVFLINGFLVGYSRPKELTAQIFFLLGSSASLGFLSYAGVWYYTGFNNIFHYSYVIGSIFFYPIFFHFFTIYPIKYEFKFRKLKIFSAYAFVMLANLYFLFASQNSNSGFINIFNSILGYSPFILLIIGISLFIISYKRISEVVLKKSLRIVLYGFLIGGIGLIYYFFIFLQLLSNNGIDYNPLYRIPAVLSLALPFSFAYSIFKYKILDTEIIVKKTIVLGILTFFITIVYLMMLYVMDSILTQYTGNKTLLTVASIVVIIFTFDYVNKWANNFVDKRFYRKRYNYRKSLLKFSEELPFINNIKDVIEKVNFAIRDAMGVSVVKFWIIDSEFVNLIQGHYRIKDKSSNNNYLIRDNIFSSLYETSLEQKSLYNVDLNEMKIPEEHKEFIKKEGIVLSIPITIKSKLIGAINFGRKPFDTPYSEEDIDLLKTIASQTSIIFENSRLKINESKKRKIEEELKIAKNIQNALIPKSEMIFPGLDISGFSEPAKEVGGDFFDYIILDKNNILISIADVSGKGVPAALYMTKLQALIRFASKLFKTPKSILCEVNKQTYRKLEKSFFVTMNMALFDVEFKKVKLSRAGHNPVLFFRNNSYKILRSKGIGLGLDNESVFNENLEEIEFDIRKDDLFVFYTDGLDEAMNAEREEFGLNNIIKSILSNIDSDSKTIQNNLMLEIKKHRGNAEQNDDISIVIVKIK
jgi:phosphoserine phosphatase RsbU/P